MRHLEAGAFPHLKALDLIPEPLFGQAHRNPCRLHFLFGQPDLPQHPLQPHVEVRAQAGQRQFQLLAFQRALTDFFPGGYVEQGQRPGQDGTVTVQVGLAEASDAAADGVSAEPLQGVEQLQVQVGAIVVAGLQQVQIVGFQLTLQLPHLGIASVHLLQQAFVVQFQRAQRGPVQRTDVEIDHLQVEQRPRLILDAQYVRLRGQQQLAFPRQLGFRHLHVEGAEHAGLQPEAIVAQQLLAQLHRIALHPHPLQGGHQIPIGGGGRLHQVQLALANRQTAFGQLRLAAPHGNVVELEAGVLREGDGQRADQSTGFERVPGRDFRRIIALVEQDQRAGTRTLFDELQAILDSALRRLGVFGGQRDRVPTVQGQKFLAGREEQGRKELSAVIDGTGKRGIEPLAGRLQPALRDHLFHANGFQRQIALQGKVQHVAHSDLHNAAPVLLHHGEPEALQQCFQIGLLGLRRHPPGPDARDRHYPQDPNSNQCASYTRRIRCSPYVVTEISNPLVRKK